MIRTCCTHCQYDLEAPENLAGFLLPYPGCRQTIEVPASDRDRSTDLPHETQLDSTAKTWSCGHCGQVLMTHDARRAECGRCGRRMARLAQGSVAALTAPPARPADDMVRFLCVRCGKRLMAPRRATGQKRWCVRCRRRVKVPQLPLAGTHW